MPLIHGSSLVAPGEVILQTRIPGIGVVLAASYGNTRGGGVPGWAFIPGEGRYGWGVPHTEIVGPYETGSGWANPALTAFRYDYRIIKTGPIDPGMGPQPLVGHTLAEVTSDRSGKLVEMTFSGGSINVALCGLPGSSGTQITVPMGTWRTGQFHGDGSHTDARAFIVPVQACLAGTVPGNTVFANLRLDPRNGSSVLDAQRGILGLNSDSDATGVGVQVLKADLSPMPLTEEVQMVRMQNGDLQIPMAARYIQVGKDTPVGGVANASVGFTLTYK
ncbi:fimbrial protein [Pseudomonas xanthosomatis]|uniref:fimbrial protein n=1 Tax=Pseudomonas xanthosomatis TaxID=2842356 RepID=UPI0035174433